ncbi:MAG: F0F1 ATP synthase subunit A [Rhodospirillales bacterium]|jgi:F-type H+-transporting ATPase subunit a|nr:F0F1 ATP synthase subunit A [Rhodospirillales bacterium]
MAEPILPYAIRQFGIDPLIPMQVFGIDISFTASAQAMLTTVLVVLAYLLMAVRRRQFQPGRLQASAEILYDFVAGTVIKNGGEEARPAIPLLITVFVFILFGTMIGLSPIKFTFTSHLIVTIGLALLVFVYANIMAFRSHGAGMLRALIPEGTPGSVLPIIFTIELVSYFFRPITLGVRLFANIVAGHIMVKLFADGCVMILEAAGLAGLPILVLPIVMMCVLYAFEFLIVFIQAYVFLVLGSTYVGEAVRGH